MPRSVNPFFQSFDPANGYEASASGFIAARSAIGSAVVRMGANVAAWRSGPRSGLRAWVSHHTDPRWSRLTVFGLDALPALLAELRARLPGVNTACAAAENSDFFGRTFDGLAAWGLIFLPARDSADRPPQNRPRRSKPALVAMCSPAATPFLAGRKRMTKPCARMDSRSSTKEGIITTSRRNGASH